MVHSDMVELEEFLNGSKGVEALDLAREVMALRAQNESLRVECDRLLNQSTNFAAVAEMAQGQSAIARERLSSLCCALANMAGELTEFLK